MWNSALGMPLGIMTREGGIMSASPHASQEYLRIPSGLLRPRSGRYELRLTEELWETAYLDEVRLLAVDHPESVQVYVNERFVPAGSSSLRLYQVARPRLPVTATEDRKSTRLNSSHLVISYAVFCLKKKKNDGTISTQRSANLD